MTNTTKHIIAMATFLLAGLFISSSAFAYDPHCDDDTQVGWDDRDDRWDRRDRRDSRDRYDRGDTRSRYDGRRNGTRQSTEVTTTRRRSATTTTTTPTTTTTERRTNRRRHVRHHRPVVTERQEIEWIRGRRYLATYTTTRYRSGRTQTTVQRVRKPLTRQERRVRRNNRRGQEVTSVTRTTTTERRRHNSRNRNSDRRYRR